MSDQKLGAVVVVSNGEPIGIMTEWDVITRVVAPGKDPAKTTVREAMSSPIQTIASNVKVGEAIRLMSRNRYRRLLVKDGSHLVGVITLSHVVGNSRKNTITLPLLEPASGARCPYCGSILKDRDDLSRHIDSVHIREEILKGAHGPTPES